MIKYDHLIGLDFDIERRNCYQLVRQFYRDNYQIELSDYACPTDFWLRDYDLFGSLAYGEGFVPLHCHPREYRLGDVVICAVGSSRGSHAALIVEGGRILHHLVGQRSSVTPYSGYFRNTTVGVYRHRDVPADQSEVQVDLRSVLPAHVLQRLQDAERLPPREPGT